MRSAPASGIADLLISVLERGVVLVLRLEGPPGDRHLLVGCGLPESAEALLIALGATSMFNRPAHHVWEDDWAEAYE